jgi:hypothetical protein
MPTAWYVGALDSRQDGLPLLYFTLCKTINNMQLPVSRTSKFKMMMFSCSTLPAALGLETAHKDACAWLGGGYAD